MCVHTAFDYFINFYSYFSRSSSSCISFVSPSLSSLLLHLLLSSSTPICMSPAATDPKPQVQSLPTLTHLGLSFLFSAFVLVFRHGFRSEFRAGFVFRAWVSASLLCFGRGFNLWVSASRFVFLIWVVDLLLFFLVFLLSFLFFFTGF